jgi:hypothetical protein
MGRKGVGGRVFIIDRIRHNVKNDDLTPTIPHGSDNLFLSRKASAAKFHHFQI